MRQQGRSQRAVARLAEKQHGVVSGEQLVDLGYSREKIAREVAAERLYPLHWDVYAVGHAAISRHGRCLAAVLSCGDDALLSHRSAAWLWGLTKRFAVPVEVTAASPRRTRRAIRVHSAEAIVADDRAEHEGIPVTAIPRTLLDFAAVDPHYLGVALDNGHRLGLIDLVAIDALISRSRGFRGVARLRTAMEMHRNPVFTRSGLERRFLALVRRSGLPTPSANAFVEGYELDVYWPAERFAVELDTYDYHGSPRAFEADRIRQENLKLAGIEIVRITGIRLDREPQAVMRRLGRLLVQRRRQIGGG
jgi:very-short-patch-repair endonuclease